MTDTQSWGNKPGGSAPSAPAAARNPTATEPPRRVASPHVWVASTYFAEGFPYGVVHTLAEVLFKSFGASLGTIGLTALFHLPWNLKFLWGPILDTYGTQRWWILAVEVAIIGGLVALSATTLTDQVLLTASAIFLMLAVVSATHDIAIDGFYLEALDEKGQSKFVGYRAAAYRSALFVVRGGLVALVGQAGWMATFLTAAAIMTLVLAYHAAYLPRVETAQRRVIDLGHALLRPRRFGWVAAVGLAASGLWAIVRTEPVRNAAQAMTERLPLIARINPAGWIAIALLVVLLGLLAALPTLKRRIEREGPGYTAAFVTFLDQPRVGLILAFVVLFRSGESFLEKMRIAFLLDAGLTEVELGLVNGTLAVAATIGATLLGGALISRHGLARWIWPCVLLQNLPNLLYAAVASLPDSGGTAALYSVVVLEAGGSGFGIAVFMVYLMRCVRPGHSASHMAIVTALMSLAYTLAGVVSGFLAEWLGYGSFFVFTFVATIPAMVLIPFLPHVRT